MGAYARRESSESSDSSPVLCGAIQQPGMQAPELAMRTLSNALNALPLGRTMRLQKAPEQLHIPTHGNRDPNAGFQRAPLGP